MKLKLLRDAKIPHQAGDIVDVSPAKGAFLISVGSAELVEEKTEVVAQKAIEPAAEVAEKAVKAPKATTTAAKKPVRKATKATKKG